MTLRDLLKKCRYKDVFNIIHLSYYKGKDEGDIYIADVGYRKVFGDLLMLPAKASREYQIYITKECAEINKKGVHVSLYCEEDEQAYAMDLTSWEDLIDSEIRKEISLDDTTTAAHILWEITFYGFSPEALNEARNELGEIVKGIENGEGVDYEIGME
jgi:hypothetical protein